MKDKFDLRKFLTEAQNDTGGVDFGDAYKNPKEKEKTVVYHDDGVNVPEEDLEMYMDEAYSEQQFLKIAMEDLVVGGGEVSQEMKNQLIAWYRENEDADGKHANMVSNPQYKKDYDGLIGKEINIIDIAEPHSEEEPDVRSVTVDDFIWSDTGHHELMFADGSNAVVFEPAEWDSFLDGSPITLHPNEVLMVLDDGYTSNGIHEELEVTPEAEYPEMKERSEDEDDIAQKLAYDFTDSNGMSLAGIVEGLLMKGKFGDEDSEERREYEPTDEDYEKRDNIISKLFQGFNEKLDKLTK